MNRWPHQLQGVNDVIAAFDRGVRRPCLTSPTGGGKTVMVKDVIRRFLSNRAKVALYTNRRLLLSQLSDDMVDDRIRHGVRMAEQDTDPDAAFQVCSIQTEISRALNLKTRPLHATDPGDLAIFDEGHLHTEGRVREVRQRHVAGGAFTLDVTATPLGMGEVCDELIVAGTMPELRDCGALVLAHHFGPDEPDLRILKGERAGDGDEFTERQAKALMGAVNAQGKASERAVMLYGRVWANYQTLNPDRRPAILFAPGVNESIWFAKKFTEHGVRAAHIDGDHVWLDGELHERSDDLWAEVLRESEAGTIKVLCNRFVLREGINAPWLSHLIFATVIGSVMSYLQAGGRVLRACPGKDSATIQDHGGLWWRMGSLNVDRVWSLQDTASTVYHKRAERIRDGKERPPLQCPQCSRIMAKAVCVCGYQFPAAQKGARAVLTVEGELKVMTGGYFKPRRVSQDSGDIGAWVRVVYRANSKKWNATFRQAEALFMREHPFGQWPDRSWPLMPISPDDIYRRVSDVPADRLRGSPEALARLQEHRDKQRAKQLALEET